MRTEEASLKIPKRMFYGQGMQTPIGVLMMQAESGAIVAANPNKSLRTVLGYVIPKWQRGLEWSDEQCERFIRSVYAGVYLGMFIYNDSISEAPHLNGILVDGQQRLYTIERYISGNLAVEGRDGKKYRWTELDPEDQAHFKRMTMGFEVVRIKDEQDLVDLYNVFNYGGTAHKESQRAVLGAGKQRKTRSPKS